MGKVFENTGKRMVIYSDNGLYRLIAMRRAITVGYGDSIRYHGQKWFINTHKKTTDGYVECNFIGLDYVVRHRRDIIDMLSKSVQFTRAYSEIIQK